MPSFSRNPISAGVKGFTLPTLASLLAPGLALAGPTGADVVAGQVGISNPDANTTRIDQASDSAIINWQQFSVGGQDYVLFNQPSASAAVLNRVVGGLPSEILGRIEANGRVFLINPQGVMFGQGAQIDVGSLVASTMDIADTDFLSGNYVFVQGNHAPASVVNAGQITAADGGFVVLQGDQVQNSGVIAAQLGDVVLASGSATTLTLDGEGLVSFTVDQAALSAQAGAANLGDIVANGGTVLMTARVAQELMHSAVNNQGRVTAQSVQEHDGAIYLAASGGDILQDGVLDASGVNTDGGEIRIESDRDIVLGSRALTLATGLSGGTVRVIAERDLDYQRGAAIDTRGEGLLSGGFVELSGRESLRIRGTVSAGHGGHLLIDPTDIVIADGGSGDTGSGSTGVRTVGELFLEGQLQSGTNVSLIASNSITMEDLTDNSLNGVGSYGGGSLFLGIGTGTSSISFVRDPDGTISANAGDAFVVGGNFTLFGGASTGALSIGAASAGGSVRIDQGGNITTGGIHAGGDVNVATLAADITLGDISAGGLIILNADHNITTGAQTAGGLAFAQSRVSGGITINGAVNVNGSSAVTTFTDGAPGFLGGAVVNFIAQAGNISVGGPVTVNGTVGNVAASSGQVIAGADVLMRARNGGTVTVNGPVTVTGSVGDVSGGSNVSVRGVRVQLGVPSSSIGGVGTSLVQVDGAISAQGTIGLFTANPFNGFAEASRLALIAGGGNIQAGDLSVLNGDIAVNANGSVTLGALSVAMGTGSAGNGIDIFALGSVTTGGILIDQAGGPGFLSIDAAGISIGGGITIGGGGGSSFGTIEDPIREDFTMARATLFGRAGNVSVSGPIALNAAPFIASQSGGGILRSVQRGDALLRIDGNDITIGSGGIDLIGFGDVQAEIRAINRLTITGLTSIMSTAGREAITGGGSDSFLHDGIARLALSAGMFDQFGNITGGVLDVGDLSLNGPSALADMQADQITIGSGTGRAIHLLAAQGGSAGPGEYARVASGDTTLVESTFGFASLFLRAAGQNAAGPGLLSEGSIMVEGPTASALFNVADDAVIQGGVDVIGDGFIIDGDFSLLDFSGLMQVPFDHSILPPLLDQGRVEWGGAGLFISGGHDSQCTGDCNDIAAGTLSIMGDVVLRGQGLLDAGFIVSGLDINPGVAGATGSIVIDAASRGPGRVLGTATQHNVLIDGFGNYDITRTIGDGAGGAALHGLAELEIAVPTSTSLVDIANAVILSGSSAFVEVNSGDVTIHGNMVVNGQAGPTEILVETSSFTPLAGAPALPNATTRFVGGLTGFNNVSFDGEPAASALRTGNITVSGTGAAVVLVQADTIALGTVSVSAAGGELVSDDPSRLVGNTGPINLPLLHDALVLIDETGTTVPQVGGLTVNAHTVHLSARGMFGGSVVIQALGVIDAVLPGELRNFENPLAGGYDDHSTEDDELSAPDLALGPSTILAQSISIAFGTTADLSNSVLQAQDGLAVLGNGVANSMLNAGTANWSGGIVTIDGMSLNATQLAVSGNLNVILNNAALTHTSGTLVSSAGDVSLNDTTLTGPTGVTAAGLASFTGGASTSISLTDVTVQAAELLINSQNDLMLSSVLATADIATINGFNISIANSSFIAPNTMSVSASGALNMSGVGINLTDGTAVRGNVSLSAGRALDFSGNAVGNVVSLASGTSVATLGSMTLGGSFDATQLKLEATELLSNSTLFALNIHAGAIDAIAEAILLDSASLTVGDGLAQNGADAGLLQGLPTSLQPASPGPNAAFIAANGVTIASLDLQGGYLFIRAPSAALGTITTAGSFFYNYRPFADTDAITVGSLESFTPPAGVVTLAFGGTGYAGDITASGTPPETKQLESANFVFLTSGSVFNTSGITTTGEVVVVGGTVINPPPPEPPPPPPPPEEEQEQVQEETSDAQLVASQLDQSSPTQQDEVQSSEEEDEGDSGTGESYVVAGDTLVDDGSEAGGKFECN